MKKMVKQLKIIFFFFTYILFLSISFSLYLFFFTYFYFKNHKIIDLQKTYKRKTLLIEKITQTL